MAHLAVAGTPLNIYTQGVKQARLPDLTPWAGSLTAFEQGVASFAALLVGPVFAIFIETNITVDKIADHQTQCWDNPLTVHGQRITLQEFRRVIT